MTTEVVNNMPTEVTPTTYQQVGEEVDVGINGANTVTELIDLYEDFYFDNGTLHDDLDYLNYPTFNIEEDEGKGEDEGGEDKAEGKGKDEGGEDEAEGRGGSNSTITDMDQVPPVLRKIETWVILFLSALCVVLAADNYGYVRDKRILKRNKWIMRKKLSDLKKDEVETLPMRPSTVTWDLPTETTQVTILLSQERAAKVHTSTEAEEQVLGDLEAASAEHCSVTSNKDPETFSCAITETNGNLATTGDIINTDMAPARNAAITDKEYTGMKDKLLVYTKAKNQKMSGTRPGMEPVTTATTVDERVEGSPGRVGRARHPAGQMKKQ